MLITLNAGKQLAAALESLQFCGDLVVVDSNSTDNTVEVAEKFGARVVQQNWLGFGPQKQFAVAQATYDWVLCLDADERVTPELERTIRAVIQQAEQGLLPSDVAGFEMPRCNFFWVVTFAMVKATRTIHAACSTERWPTGAMTQSMKK